MATIWHQPPDLAFIQGLATDTIDSHLGIKITEIGDDFVVGTMPADKRTFQPYGVVHGGANVVLAESLGSIAGALCIDPSKFQCFGQEVSASHIRSVSSGVVTGKATPIHIGRRSHIWQIALTNDEGKLSCLAKLTLAIVPIRT